MVSQAVSFRGPDGKAIHLIVHRAAEKVGREPGILLVPGRPLFPEDYGWIIEPLVASGFAVAGLYARGYGSEGLDDRCGPRAVDTVRRTVAHLVSQKIFRGRIGLVGHSSGAQTGLLALAEEPRIRAAVALSTITDLASHMKAIRSFLPSFEADYRGVLGRDPEDMEEEYLSRSPIRYADSIRAPVLFVVGEMDRITPAYQSRLLQEEIERQGVPSRLVVVPWAGHFFQPFGFDGYLFDPVVTETRAWLVEHLVESAGPKTDVHPGERP